MMNRSASLFTNLICLAFGVSLLGLGANLMHLKALMSRPDDNNLTHPILRGSGGSQSRALLLQDLHTEEHVFSRLLKESVSHVEECAQQDLASNHAVASVAAAASASDASVPYTRKQLGRFGFMNALNNQLSIPSSSSSSKQQCYDAPSTACQVTKYSMIVVTSGTNLRPLFLNLLSWLTYANVAQLVVILPPAANATLAQDAKYGLRILAWHADSSHKISLHVTSSLWTANYATLLTDTTMTTTSSGTSSTSSNHNNNNNNDGSDYSNDDAIVWMNGDIVDKGNHRGLDAGFELWKRHANAVVFSSGWKVTKEPSPPPPQRANNSTAFCKRDQITATSIGDDAAISIPTLHGLVLHRNYLCFLSHSVLKQLHRLTETLDEERLAVAMLLQQVSSYGQAPLLFPSKVRAEGTPEQRQLTRDSQAQASKAKSKSISMLSRILWTTTTTTTSSSSSSSIDSRSSNETTSSRWLLEEDDEFSLADASTSRRLSEVPSDDLDVDFVTAVAGFFGSLPTKSIGWCANCSHDDETTTEEVPINLIPWMSEKCSKMTAP